MTPSALESGLAKLRADLVPGLMRCAKCEFVLVRTSLHVSNGTTSPGGSDTEPCPNGCGPLWPVTWRERALQAETREEALLARLDAQDRLLARLHANHERYGALTHDDLGDLAAYRNPAPAGSCTTCGGEVHHREGKPGEFDHQCNLAPAAEGE